MRGGSVVGHAWAGVALALLAVAAAGCGGSSGPTYSLAKTKACLDSAGLPATRDRNQLLAASGGNLMVEFGYGSPKVFIAFGKNGSEAKTLEAKAVAAAQKFESLDAKTVVAGVEVNGNVFFYSDAGPLTQVARTKIDACLK